MREDIVPAAINSTDPGDVVRFTQSMRYRMFDELTNNGQQLTANFSEVALLLNSMDSAALTTRKLDIESRDVDNGAKVLQAHRELQQMLGGRDPFLRHDNSPIPVAQRLDEPVSEHQILPGVTLLPGEDAQYEQSLSISDYVQSDD